MFLIKLSYVHVWSLREAVLLPFLGMAQYFGAGNAILNFIPISMPHETLRYSVNLSTQAAVNQPNFAVQ